jgi:uncharacterized protein (DUF58 family)
MVGEGLKYIRPDILSRLVHLNLKSRQVVEGVFSGLHDSIYHGYSVEFTEHREYSQGDDIRHIDWKAYAKSDRYLIKEYEEETNLRGLIMVDASASMDFGSGGISKWEYACYLAASLSYLLLKQRDAAGLIVFSDEVRAVLPPKTRISYLKQIDNALSETQPGGMVSTQGFIPAAHSIVKQRGLVIFISDLLDHHEESIQELRRLMHRKNEVIVLQVLDGEELEFPFTGLTQFEDLELQDRVMADPLSIRKEYRRRMRSFLERCANLCRGSSMEYQLFDTSTPPGVALAEYLSTRDATRKAR